jgi:Chaperone of endosialidase
MAFDPTKPATTDNYSTGFVPGLIANIIALSQWLDSANTAITGTPPTFAKRFNRSSGMLEEYNGSAWGVLTHHIPGNAAGLAAGVAGAVPYQSAVGATGFSAAGTAGAVLVSGGAGAPTWTASPTFGTPALGTPASGNLANCSFPVLNQSTTGNAGSVSNGVYTVGNQTVGGIKSFSTAILSPTAGDYGIWKTGDIGGLYPAWTGARAAAVQVDAVDNTKAYAIWRATKWGERHLAAMDVYAGDTAVSIPRVDLHVGNTTNAFIFQQGGNFTAAGNITGTSDTRLKKDWAALPADFVERLAGIQHGSYTRIDTGARQAGVSAQDLQALLPEAVHAGTDEQQTLSVAYGNAALVACVALARELGLLRAEVAQLRGAA